MGSQQGQLGGLCFTCRQALGTGPGAAAPYSAITEKKLALTDSEHTQQHGTGRSSELQGKGRFKPSHLQAVPPREIP